MRKWRVAGGPWILAAAIIAVAGAAVAHDAILLRRKIMKAVGSATKEATEMAKGQRPFDAKKAASHMSLIAGTWSEIASLFPPDSKSGARTRAAAEIWSNFADFDAQGQRMADDAVKAAEAAAIGLEAFAKAFEPVANSCKECHKTYMTRD